MIRYNIVNAMTVDEMRNYIAHLEEYREALELLHESNQGLVIAWEAVARRTDIQNDRIRMKDRAYASLMKIENELTGKYDNYTTNGRTSYEGGDES